MLHLLSSYGPLTVAVDASNWVNYQGGIIHYHCGEMPRNHAVQIVGYDLTGIAVLISLHFIALIVNYVFADHHVWNTLPGEMHRK